MLYLKHLHTPRHKNTLLFRRVFLFHRLNLFEFRGILPRADKPPGRCLTKARGTKNWLATGNALNPPTASAVAGPSTFRRPSTTLRQAQDGGSGTELNAGKLRDRIVHGRFANRPYKKKPRVVPGDDGVRRISTESVDLLCDGSVSSVGFMHSRTGTADRQECLPHPHSGSLNVATSRLRGSVPASGVSVTCAVNTVWLIR